jgi:hypothetical protein
MRLCIFCLRVEGDPRTWCPPNDLGLPNLGCTYGGAHEFPCGVCGHLMCKVHVPGVEKPKQQKKIDKQVCTKCSLHARNPASASSECKHEYPS